jgi:uncharacterized protein (TIGR02118 family)
MNATAASRRRFVTGALSMAALAGGLGTAVAAQTKTSCSAKIVFILYKKADLSREQCVAEWMGPQHTGIVGKVASLRKWVQNYAITPSDGTPDGMGELWFDNAEAMDQAMKSPEMGAAVEDAKRFLDMEKTYAIVVVENTIIA